jgi:N-acyl-L-homoserine lactone synthetase
MAVQDELNDLKERIKTLEESMKNKLSLPIFIPLMILFVGMVGYAVKNGVNTQGAVIETKMAVKSMKCTLDVLGSDVRVAMDRIHKIELDAVRNYRNP